ncbi:MAG: heme-binding domain-containing protein [Bacteroidales bacterium]|nr:heme-binding domain-containing protein [Bacteroidales bacterium]
MGRTQKILLVLIVLIIAIQFIRPERNIENNPSRYDIFHKTGQPTEISAMVQSACYDCHSNHTAYPWYASVAPVSWIIANHVKEGKGHLNFSDWKLLEISEQQDALEDIIEVLEDQEMPLKPYQWLHSEAKMTPEKSTQIINWAKEMKLSLN